VSIARALTRSAAAAWLALAALQARADVVPPSPAPAPAAQAPAEAAPAPIAAIPAPDIVSRAEDAKALVRRIHDGNAETPLQQEIETRLPETSARLRERTARAEALLEASPTIDALNDLDNEWHSRLDRLKGWRLGLTHIAQQIETDRALLSRERELWEKTHDAPETAALPPATQDRISETLGMLSRAERKLQDQRSKILTLQDEVASEELVVNGMVERMARQRGDQSKHLFVRDAPPLWSSESWAPSGDAAFVPEKVRAAIERKVDLLREFITLSVARLQVETAIFVVALGLLLLARRRVTRSPAATDPALEMPTRIFERPVSAALVVAIAWTYFLMPRSPGVLSEAEALVLLLPVLRLLPPELAGGMRAGLIGLAALFLLGSLRALLSAVPTVERFLMLPETAGTIWLLVWVLRKDHADRLREIGLFGPVAVPVARAALAVCLAAAACNVLGQIQLSRLLLRGVLSTIYAGIAIYALVRFATGVVTAALRSDWARRLQSVRDHGELMRQRINGLQRWVGLLAWIGISLRVVGIEPVVRSALATTLQARLEVGTVSISVGNVVAFFVAIWLSVQLSRFLRFFLDEDVLPHVSLPRGVPAAISTGVHYAILAAGFLIAIGAAGIDLSKFSLIAGALGVGIGFGLQNVVNNFVSGLILLFERPVQTGDQIDIGSISGEVKRIGIRSSTVRTGDGADVIVPNATLISERLVNWTFSDRMRRVDLELVVGLGADANKVIAILLETARARSEVLSLPEPVALFTRFADAGGLVFQLQVWCRVEIGGRVRSELGVALLEALRGAGIELPIPQRDVHLRVESRSE
jgi:small-conductance mechanosensitive channel